MNLILDFLQNAFTFVLSMTVLLGVLIFIHELGHFLVAKYYNVKVLTFSLGFGPKILKYQKGETTYCVSAIPFGGYVKMYGDEFGGEVPADMKNRSFLDKPIHQRIFIALAGPVMNLFLAFVLFVIIALSGEKVIAPQLGDVDKTTAAYQQGFRSGDKILEIDDKKITRWEEVEQTVSSSKDKTLNFLVLRETQEEPVKITATPVPTEGKTFFQLGDIIGQIEGLDFIANSSLVAVSDKSSIFARLGLQTGDQITKINGIKVNTLRELQEVLLSEAGKNSIEIEVERHNIQKPDDKSQNMKVVWDLKKIPFPDRPEALGIEKPETFIGQVQKESPAQKAGLLALDHIEKINNKEIESFKDIISVVSNYKEGDEPLRIQIARDGQTLLIPVSPQMTEVKSDTGPSEKRFTVGIVPLKAAYVEHVKWTAPSFLGALTWGAQKTWEWTYNTVMSFVLLIQNKVSAKNLGGFISIGQMAKKSWDLGLDAFLRIMAIISLNLFILNLLPIPVLDGGHILLFTIEAIKGAPLSLKKMAIAQQIGVFFLLFLLAFSLFNDFSRLFGFS